MLAWKEIERDLEEAKQQQKKKRKVDAAAGGGKDDAWWQDRLRALTERDWTMCSELERLKGEWGSLGGCLDGTEREGKAPGARITL